MPAFEVRFIGTVEKVDVVGEENYFIVTDVGRFHPHHGSLKNDIAVVLDGPLVGTTYRILKYNYRKNACLVAKQRDILYRGDTKFHVAIVGNDTVQITPEQFDLLQSKAKETIGLLEEVPTRTFEPDAESGTLQEVPDLRIKVEPEISAAPKSWEIPIQAGQVWGIRRIGTDPSTKEKFDTIEQARRIISVSDQHGCCFKPLGMYRAQTTNIERRNGKPEFEYREHNTRSMGVKNFRNWIRNVGAELIPENAIKTF